jgi:hypothetical protein
LSMLTNIEYTLSSCWMELEMFGSNVEPPHCIWQVSGYNICQDGVFNQPKKVIQVEIEMIDERVRQDLFEASGAPYWNANYLF